MTTSEIDRASEPFGIDPAACEVGVPLLDVRRAATYATASSRIGGAHWRDPAAVATWAGELTPGAPVVVYCVHGHEVSRGVALQLRAAGIEARFLRGGIEAWQAAGLPLEGMPRVA